MYGGMEWGMGGAEGGPQLERCYVIVGNTPASCPHAASRVGRGVAERGGGALSEGVGRGVNGRGFFVKLRLAE